jgi:hypothetical protein
MWAIGKCFNNVELYYMITRTDYNYLLAVRNGGLHTMVCFFYHRVPQLFYSGYNDNAKIMKGDDYE